MIAVRRIELPATGIEALVAESLAEGHTFLDSLIEDFATGEMRFDRPGEALFGAFEDETLIGIGGLTVDPHANMPDTGRLRKIFVRAAARRRGVGEALVKTLVAAASSSFRRVRLQAENASAARLYERLGFSPIDEEQATHAMLLRD